MSVEATPELKLEIKRLIIESLKIPDVKPEDIDDSSSLFEEGNTLHLDFLQRSPIWCAWHTISTGRHPNPRPRVPIIPRRPDAVNPDRAARRPSWGLNNRGFSRTNEHFVGR